MTQNWFIFAGFFIVASAQSVSSAVSGTCASIGYSDRCCRPSSPEAYDECRAKDIDGECFCNTDCHTFMDCCEDAYCPYERRTCADVGITQCCNDPNGTGLCDVNFRDIDGRCSCDIFCHARNDCCPDARIFCKPCDDAGKYPECYHINRNNAINCFAPKGNCYCDPLCKCYGDCCADAQSDVSLCSPNGSSSLPRSRLQSSRNDMGFIRRRFYSREQRIHQQGGNTKYAYQETPAARLQQEFINERKFRSRPRVAGQPSA